MYKNVYTKIRILLRSVLGISVECAGIMEQIDRIGKQGVIACNKLTYVILRVKIKT